MTLNIFIEDVKISVENISRDIRGLATMSGAGQALPSMISSCIALCDILDTLAANVWTAAHDLDACRRTGGEPKFDLSSFSKNARVAPDPSEQ